MQDPNADTEWNDVLRAKGILPPKQEKEISEDDIINMVESTITDKTQDKDMGDMNLDELDELEDDIDEEDERMFEEYKRKRIAEMKEAQMKSNFGEVREITKVDYVDQVNKAGEGVWVVLHVYKPSVPLCKLLNDYMVRLAQKFPATKFLKSIADLCIPNYPDKNLPTIFVYYEGDMKKQFIGPIALKGMNLKYDELEWMLSEVGAIKSDLEENPNKGVHDVMQSAIRSSNINNDDSDSDY